MDRPELSAAIIDELGQLFVSVLKDNAAKLVESDLDGMEQRVQDMERTVFGRVVEQAVAVAAATHSGDRPMCAHCHLPMRLIAKKRPRKLLGLVGGYTIFRPYFVCDSCHQSAAPLDEHLGIGAGALSPGLERVACRLGIDDSFEDAAGALQETLRIELPDEAIRRVAEGIGQVAESEARETIALAQGGQEPLPAAEVHPTSPVLLVETDGAMVHEVDSKWHEVKSGLVAALGPQTRRDKETGRTTLVMGKPSYCAGFERAEAFWYRLYVEACRCGLGSKLVTMILVLGDGAGWIWHHVPDFLEFDGVEVVEIVDFYHACEHLAQVAGAVFGEGSAGAKVWLEGLRWSLERKGVGPILAALAELTPEGAEATEEVRKAIGYFTEHAGRMDYPKFIARQLPIGSGAIESACKTLIEEREKGAGMRWTEQGAQSIATLRALHKSGRWARFWKTHPQCRRPAVFPGKPSKPLASAKSEKLAA